MSNYLSAKELFKYFNGHISELPQRGGAKEYAPDGSWLQAKRIQLFNEERREVLSEQLVKKKKHLIKGEWIPDLQKVELNELGKFWMTTGHVESGRNLMYPEEALSLMEKGDLEIYYGGIPLSIQEAYSTLLGDRVPLEHHQVYNHLSRLGYIIFRHRPLDNFTPYEVTLGLNKRTTESRKQRKKRRKALLKTEIAEKQMKMDDSGTTVEPSQGLSSTAEPVVTSEMIPTREAGSDVETSTRVQSVDMDCDILPINSDSGRNRNNGGNSMICDLHSQHGLPNTSRNNVSRYRTVDRSFISPMDQWPVGLLKSDEQKIIPQSDFSDIWLPDACQNVTPEITLPVPSLLPTGITVEKEKYQINFSYFKRTMQKKPEGSRTHEDYSFGLHTGRPKVAAKNWAEYKKLTSGLTFGDNLLTSPVGHLWKGEVQPLIRPTQAVCTASLLDRMKIIQNVNFTRNAERYPGTETSTVQFVYDVYYPDAAFSKSCPGHPAFRLCIKRHDEPSPELADILHAAKGCLDGAAIQWAVVDEGDITFYSFNGVDLPRDVTVH